MAHGNREPSPSHPRSGLRVVSPGPKLDRGGAPCRPPSWWGPSGATRARASSPTSWRARWTWSSATRAATTPGTPSSSASAASPCAWCRRASCTPHVVNVIGNGVVVDPRILLGELDTLDQQGIDTDQPRRVGQRPPDPARTTPTSTSCSSATSARTSSARPRAASAPPTPTRPPASASGCRTCSTRKIFREKLEVVLGQKAAILAKVYNRLAPTADEICDAVPRRDRPPAGAPHRRLGQPGPRRPRGRQAA